MPEAGLSLKINFENCNTLQEVWEKVAQYKEDVDYITWFTAIKHAQRFLPSEVICNEKANSTIMYFLHHINCIKDKKADINRMQISDFLDIAKSILLATRELKSSTNVNSEELKTSLFNKLFDTLICDIRSSNDIQKKEIDTCFEGYDKEQLKEIDGSIEQNLDKWSREIAKYFEERDNKKTTVEVIQEDRKSIQPANGAQLFLQKKAEIKENKMADHRQKKEIKESDKKPSSTLFCSCISFFTDVKKTTKTERPRPP